MRYSAVSRGIANEHTVRLAIESSIKALDTSKTYRVVIHGASEQDVECFGHLDHGFRPCQLASLSWLIAKKVTHVHGAAISFLDQHTREATTVDMIAD